MKIKWSLTQKLYLECHFHQQAVKKVRDCN